LQRQCIEHGGIGCVFGFEQIVGVDKFRIVDDLLIVVERIGNFAALS
jgi:hypothetical protein